MKRHARLFAHKIGHLALALGLAGCATAETDGIDPTPAAGGGGSGAADAGASGGSGGIENPKLDGSSSFVGDPKTCEQAAQAKSYVGCEFWPTVTANNVWSIFDFAVVVANASDQPATVTIERAGKQVEQGEVPANGLKKFFLPWVTELKGPDADNCGGSVSISESRRAPGGAYHLTSSLPVTVYQFNPLEYRGQGGPSSKNWDTCPGSSVCADPGVNAAVGCYSFSNDASLLLPATALTGNYRVTGQRGWPTIGMGTTLTITGTTDATMVKLKLSKSAAILTGPGLPSASPGVDISFPIARGEVIQLIGNPANDLGGTLIQADHPVQVITGVPCANQPYDLQKPACDHMEESVFPAETLGKRYFVTVPTGPNGKPVGQIVRLFGNVDGTALTYPGKKPLGAPSTIDAGSVVDLGIVDSDFEIVGDHELAIATFQLGGSLVDPDSSPQKKKGDPSQSAPTAVEQYKKKYVFLAPDDYDVSYIDLVMPENANVILDGAPIDAALVTLGSGYALVRQKLGPGTGGAHVLESNEPVGLQVVGYGSFTSYQYPGGLDLASIAPPPIK